MSLNQRELKDLHVVLAQMTSTEDVPVNLELISSTVEQVMGVDLESRPNIICFPENALYFPIPGEGHKRVHFHIDSPEMVQLEKLSQAHQVDILLGSVPLWPTSSKIKQVKAFNSTVLFSPHSKARSLYDKIHLFDVNVDGQSGYHESDQFSPGQSPSIFEYQGWRLGLSICYDIRFSELYSHYAEAAVDMLFVPASFLVPTGAAHWHQLLSARAIESQAYVIAPAQVGGHIRDGFSRSTYGHSLAVDPWGIVLDDLAEKSPCWSSIILTSDRINWVRNQIPMQQHRRLNLKP